MSEIIRTERELREAMSRARAILDAEERAATEATTATAPPAEDDPAAQARAALAAEQERAELVKAARALVRKKGAEQGFTIEADELSDQEALEAAGIAPRELSRREQQIERQEERYRADPAKYERNQAVDAFEQKWWSLSESERRATAAELGLDYETCKTLKVEEMQRRFP